MAGVDSIEKIQFLYHFTDTRNLSVIRQVGGLLPFSHLKTRGIAIPAPGGNDWSRDADTLKGMENFVHLCFRNNHPMEFRARQDGRIAESIFLQVHASVLQMDGVLFSNDVSNKAGVDHVPIKKADELIDFEVLYTHTDWTDPTIRERLTRAEKYEVLVPALIPLSYIRNMPNG